MKIKTGRTLTKKDAEEKIKSGKFKHNISHIGIASKQYLTKYIIDLEIMPTITEVRIYAEQTGKFQVPEEYRSDVTYGTTVKALAIDLYSEGVVSNDRICGFIGFAAKCEGSLSQIKSELMNTKTVSTDATVVTENGK